MKYRSILFIGLILFLGVPKVTADVRMHGLFSDHMVIQRNTEVPVWGWANPSERIVINTSWGESVKTKAAADSSWRVMLKTPDAGGPYTMTVKGKNTIVINDVLSGEVWFCSGQSNMDFEMAKFVNDSREVKYQPLVEFMRNEVATANDDHLRHIEVPRKTSLYKKVKNFSADWHSADSAHVGSITAIGYFYAKELRHHLNVPVGLIECSWGGTRIQPWIAEEIYMADPELKAYFESGRKNVATFLSQGDSFAKIDSINAQKIKTWIEGGKKDRKPYPSKHPTLNEQLEATLHNGMISSVVPYGIKGVLWYQGESNSHFLEEQYEKYFLKLIQSWRDEWGQGDMPFYWTQLAAYRAADERSDIGWAMVNDHLRRGLQLPNTGMAVLHDIGEAADVHPHNKLDAGKRLALLALKNDYGIDIPEASGPLYLSHEIKDNKIEVVFSHAGSGLMAGYKPIFNETIALNVPLTWFEIAGKDKVWKRAIAKIISKDRIELYHPGINNPVYVRYGWSSNPDGANLYNKEGLPAAVFTTEEINK